jgi:hypothetical protein
LQGAFAAHVRAWRALLHAGDAGGIVLEDDCIFYSPHLLAPMQYPTDAVTLLGGCFRGFGMGCVCGKLRTFLAASFSTLPFT